MGDLKVAVRQERHGWGQGLTEAQPSRTGESLGQWPEACEHEYLVHRLLMSEELTGGNERILSPGDQPVGDPAGHGHALRRESIKRLLPATCSPYEPAPKDSRPHELQQPPVSPANRAEPANHPHLLAIEYARSEKRL